MHHILIAYKSFISAPQPFCCNLWAHWVRLWQLLLLPIEAKYHILSLTVSYKQKINKTNTCTTISLSTLAIHFICQRFPIFIPSYPSYNAVQNYHRRSTRNYRSDQIEQNKQLTFYQRISTIPTVLAPVLVASAWTTTPVSFLSISRQRRRQQRLYELQRILTSYKRISTIPPVSALVLVASAWTTTTFPTYVSFLFDFQGYDNNNNLIVPLLFFATKQESRASVFFHQNQGSLNWHKISITYAFFFGL